MSASNQDGSFIRDLLSQIDEKNFGKTGDLDEGEDISDSELLNGFMDGYNEEDEEDEALEEVEKTTLFYLFVSILVVLLFGVILLKIFESMSEEQ